MSKRDVRLARRYARALFEVTSPDDLDTVYSALLEFAEIWAESSEFKSALQNPANPPQSRINILQDLGSKLCSERKEVTNFFVLLQRNGRLEIITEVVEIFKGMIDELRRLLALEITSAFSLIEQEREEIRSALKERFGSMTSIEWKTDPTLIGGLIIKYGDRLLDSSIRGSLDNLRINLLA